MKNLIPLITTLLISLTLPRTLTRAVYNVTDLFASLLKNNRTSYQVWNGYQDIDKYLPSSQASMYYTLWECSTRRFADHSVPVIFYLAGGPGRSSQFAAFREFGPIEISFKDGKYVGVENPFSWNYYAHLVFVDSPVGVGYSYNKGKPVGTLKQTAGHLINFLANFLKDNRWGLNSGNPLYLAGEGYAGHVIPTVVQELGTNNKSLGIKIQGIILGGAFVDSQRQINHYSQFLSAAGIVTQKQRNQTNEWATQGILKIRNSQLNNVRPYIQNIWSAEASKKYYNGMDVHNYKRYSEDLQGSDYVNFLKQRKPDLKVPPQDATFIQYSKQVNQAFSQDLFVSSLSSLQYALNNGKRVLIYNGQNDFIVNSAGVLTWLQNVEWPGARFWRETKKEIWRESGRVAGWVKRYGDLVVVLVRGAGHYIYEDQKNSEQAVYLMLNNFFSKKW